MDEYFGEKILKELKRINDRLSTIEARLNIQPTLPKPTPFFPPKPPIIDNSSGTCQRCGKHMSHIGSNRYWNGSLGMHEYHEEWICEECDSRSVKLC